MPPHMHPRVQRSGRTYYYMYTQDKPRKEIALGDDYILALKKYVELNIVGAPPAMPTFGDVNQKYLLTAVPKLAANTVKSYKSDVKHLLEAFNDAPLDQIKPLHIRQFLDAHSDKKTTANRCKRLFSTMWNQARGWGYTDLPNPCEGIKGHKLKKRTYYITDDIFIAVRKQAAEPLRDAMDLAYLTGQRPSDALKMTVRDIIDGHLVIDQNKTGKPLRIAVVGQLKDLLDRIQARKEGHSILTDALLVNMHGKRLTKAALRYQFDQARKAAKAELPDAAPDISQFRFGELRSKAADDTADQRGEQAASDLLGHDNLRTTQKHYLRRGKRVDPTK